ncbi:MAG: PDDEXK nuclease domain-containing protein [Thermodesulfobacteriota bacterium]
MKKTSETVMTTTRPDMEYKGLLTDISQLLEQARHTTARSINTILTVTYWEIGRRIVEFEQKGERRAEYGRELLKRLSKDLTAQFGRGFSERNIEQMRLFYINWPISQTLSAKSPPPLPHGKIQTLSGEFTFESSKTFSLPWSHYVRLMALEDKDKRDFYEEGDIRAGWSVRQLDRQINSMLYERVALSKKKGDMLKKTESSGDRITAEEAIKDPYVLEFLGLPEPISERDLENALIQHMTDFLLELGYGFTFVARQKRLQIGSESYYLDLLFFQRRGLGSKLNYTL